IVSIAFVYNNYSFYDRPIAQVIETNVEDTSEVTDQHHNKDKLFMQHIVAKVKNGEKKGQLIHLTNEYSSSGRSEEHTSELQSRSLHDALPISSSLLLLFTIIIPFMIGRSLKLSKQTWKIQVR